MVDFALISNDPTIRAIVQENTLERTFHDALFPKLMFREECAPQKWPEGVGDTQIFSAVGLIQPNMEPLRPGEEPTPETYPMEQWSATLHQYAGTIDSNMVNSMQALANLFLRNSQQLGMQAAQSLNRKVRDQMYNAAESGWTVADGAQAAVTTLRVKRLNGFTRARNPALANASQVRFDLVSSSNPLSIEVFDTAGPAFVTRNVIAFTADTDGDEVGPGTITLSGGAVTVLDRAAVRSVDRTHVIRVGGGEKVDDIGAGDVPTFQNVRDAVARFWEQNVPAHGDGRFHAHFDPVSQSKMFSDIEFQRLITGVPDYVAYKEFALGEMLNTVFFRNSECPIPQTVRGGATASWDIRDPFAGELFNTGASTGVRLHRMLFTAAGAIMEHYSDLGALMTEAGITGKVGVGDPRITNNGIDIMSDRIQMIIRAPLNRLQDKVSTSWKFIGDWPVRTDASSGDSARYKRFLTVIHGE